MGHTLTQWQGQVEDLVRDAGNVDVTAEKITSIGIVPALAQYSIDRDRMVVEEGAGDGTAYLSLPSGWSDGFSRIERIEYPTGQRPAEILDDRGWYLDRDPDDVDTTVVVLASDTVTSGAAYRISYSAPWPTPDGTAGTDLLDDTAYTAVTSLAASLVVTHLAAEAARQRSGALVTDFVSGDDRHRTLTDTARTYRDIYNRYVGRATSEDAAGARDAVAVSRRMDHDPGYTSLFHGGHR